MKETIGNFDDGTVPGVYPGNSRRSICAGTGARRFEPVRPDDYAGQCDL